MTEGPLSQIGRQLIRQDVAQSLWNLAHREVAQWDPLDFEGTPEESIKIPPDWRVTGVRHLLCTLLPHLLINDQAWEVEMEQLLPTWTGSLTALTQMVPTQTALF